MLDPRISFEGLKQDSEDDPSMMEHLEASKTRLEEHYHASYAHVTPRPAPQAVIPASTPSSPQKVNFTSRYRKAQQSHVDELEEYFKLPQEDFDACDPVQWWGGRRAQFPNLSRLARDILSIPGQYKKMSHLHSAYGISRICCRS